MEQELDISPEDINSGKYVFNDIFQVYQYLKGKGWSFGWYSAPHFEVMELSSHKSESPRRIVASPTPFQPLFRGQNAFYKPCYPSLYRKDWSVKEELERLVQIEDFKIILNDHPEIQDNIDAGLEINYEGLAQHYGIETNIIDLTNSFGVAAFFATTDYDSLTDTYRPIEETYRQGVIYFLPTGIFTNFSQTFIEKDLPYSIWPIGMEALPRPGEQRGFGAYLKKGVDFNCVSPIKFFFRQNKWSSIECCRRFNFGMHLFPFDPIVEKVRNIRKYRIYGKDSVSNVVTNNINLGLDTDEAVKTLTDNGCVIVESTPFRYTKQELNFITDRYHKMYPDSFPNG